jgi:preprotein translocase YajC subunit
MGGGFEWIFLVGFLVIFYLMIWRPQAKRAKEQKNLLSSLQKGDEVVTTGGIAGKITKVSDDFRGSGSVRHRRNEVPEGRHRRHAAKRHAESDLSYNFTNRRGAQGAPRLTGGVMLNKYPLWKYILILAVLAIGLIYSAPNLYPDDPAIQISGASTALQVNQADLDRVSKALTDAINVKAATLAAKGRAADALTKQEDQLPAKDVVRKALGDDYVVALNLAQTTPQWLRNLARTR